MIPDEEEDPSRRKPAHGEESEEEQADQGGLLDMLRQLIAYLPFPSAQPRPPDEQADRAERILSRDALSTRSLPHDVVSTGALPLDMLSMEPLPRDALPIELVPRDAPPPAAAPAGPVVPPRPPPAGYHNYAQLVALIHTIELAYPHLVQLQVIGQSYEGRNLWAARITDNVTVQHPDRAAVLFIGGQHAREHLAVEMCLFVLQALVTNNGPDLEITRWLASQVVYIVFNANPDGSEFDFGLSTPGTWRKNRQPNQGTGKVGTDQNRNWAYKWTKDGAGQPPEDDYGGPAPFSAPETAALSAFIAAHRQDDVEQIVALVDFHSFAQAVLYPFAYTMDRLPGDGSLTETQRAAFERIARAMARSIPTSRDGHPYFYEQSSYLNQATRSGVIIDWAWAVHQIFAFTIELYPASIAPGSDAARFMPPPTVIAREVSRAFAAVRVLLREVQSEFPPPSKPDPPQQ